MPVDIPVWLRRAEQQNVRRDRCTVCGYRMRYFRLALGSIWHCPTCKEGSSFGPAFVKPKTRRERKWVRQYEAAWNILGGENDAR